MSGRHSQTQMKFAFVDVRMLWFTLQKIKWSVLIKQTVVLRKKYSSDIYSNFTLSRNRQSFDSKDTLLPGDMYSSFIVSWLSIFSVHKEQMEIELIQWNHFFYIPAIRKTKIQWNHLTKCTTYMCMYFGKFIGGVKTRRNHVNY